MVIKNNTLLIFDFDNTITNGHMHAVFSGRHSGIEKSDYNSAAKNAVTDHNIKDFLKNTDGIKNEEGLKSTLQSALSNGIEVNIASYTGYPNAVKRVVENHLGLSKEQADSISVFGGFPADYDNELPKDLKEQQSQVGKNLHICKAIVNYKNNHNGQLPKTVMLVDDSAGNIKKINEFVESMSKREVWLEENGLSLQDIKNIKFEGARVPKEDKNVGYLERVQEFISTRKEESPQLPPKLKNLNAVSQNNEEPPQLLPKKRKSSDGMVADGENKKQDIKGMLSSETQANPTRSKRHAMMLDPQQIESIHQNAEEPPLGKKYAHTETISLLKAFETIRDFFQDCGQKIINTIHRLLKKEVITGVNAEEPPLGKKYAHTETISLLKAFETIRDFFQDCGQQIINTIHRLLKKEVITGVKEQGYDVNSEKGKSEITIYGNKSIDIDKIKTDFIDTSLIRIMELGEEKIKDLNNNYKGDQLGREISKLLNAGSQKENINSNYNDGEPIFQTRKEALNADRQKKDINSNSVRGNYNGGEPTHQTVQEARNYHRQKKGIDSNPVSKKPLAPPVPPKNYTEKVTQNRNNNIIERGG